MNDVMQAGRFEMRIKHYASDLADMVERGEITEQQANEWLASFQDRVARDGVWS